MKLLIVSQYFSPEHFIINDIVGKLIAQGHEVVIATGKPNYPDGEIYPGYRAWGCQLDSYLGAVDVLRVPVWPRGRGGAMNMILNYLSFVLAGLIFFPWMLRKREFDTIFVFAPSPITQAIPAILLKWIKKARLALWIQDLWPESLAATGFVKNRSLLAIAGGMVRRIYACCDTLLVQSHAFIDSVAHYAAREKIIYYPNSIDTAQPRAEVALPSELKQMLENDFCIVFAGNLGTAQALDTVLQAAIRLRAESDIRLVLVGSGSRMTWLKEQKTLHALDNLVLPGRFPSQAMPEIFDRAAALLVSLNDEDIFSYTIPSKVQAYLAAGRPIIASLNGEGARVVQEARAGLCAPAEQVEPLVAAIREMRASSESSREEMGRSARAYFDKNFDMDMQVRRLVEILEN